MILIVSDDVKDLLRLKFELDNKKYVAAVDVEDLVINVFNSKRIIAGKIKNKELKKKVEYYRKNGVPVGYL